MWASKWIMPTGRLPPTARRIGNEHKWSPPGDERPYALADELLEVVFNPHQGVVDIGRIDRAVAEIGDIGKVIGNDLHRLVHAPHHRRHVAHLARRMPRAWPVSGAAIPGNADNADVEIPCLIERHMRQSHEGCDAAKARRDKPRCRLIEFFQGWLLSFNFCDRFAEDFAQPL